MQIFPTDRELLAEAALSTRWPLLHVFAADEGTIQAARRAIEAVLGPLPQADEIEPWDGASGEPWELRAAMPGLSRSAWDTIRGIAPDAILAPGESPVAIEARDSGLRADEIVGVDGIVATMYADADGRPRPLDLARPLVASPDSDWLELETEVAQAVAERVRGLGFLSDRGPDTLQPVVHRTTGRWGFEIAVPAEVWDTFPPESTRAGVFAAVASVVAARRTHPRVRLAPDMVWDERMGAVFVVWVIGPPGEPIPGDGACVFSDVPSTGVEGWFADLHVELAPAPADFEGVVAEASRLAEQIGLHGALPRWVRGPKFAARFSANVGALPIDALGRLDCPFRVVPGEPHGLGDVASVLDPHWRVGSERWMGRLRDGVRDRDRLPKVQARPIRDRDRAILNEIDRLLPLHPDAMLAIGTRRFRPVADPHGREGIELELGAAVREAVVSDALAVLADLQVDGLAAVGFWGFRATEAVAQLWWADHEAEAPPEWV